MDLLTSQRLRHLRDVYWHPVCHRAELPKACDFIRLSWLGDDVVAYNDNGAIIVFDNVCPHRGARFLLESSGNAPLVCRYHAWAYRGGELRVARKEDFSPCEIARLDIHKLQTAWCGEFLFAAIEPRVELNAQLEGVFEPLAAISHTIGARFDLNAYVYECDWRTAVENALEPYHINLVHAETLRSLQLTPGSNEFFGSNSIWRAEIQDERINKSLAGMARFFDMPPQFPGYMSFFLFPFSMVSSTYGFSHSLQNFFPGNAAQQTNFTSRLLTAKYRDGAAGVLTAFFESTAAFNRQVFDEDHEICKRVHPRIWEMGRRMPLSKSEEKVAHFRRLLKTHTDMPEAQA